MSGWKEARLSEFCATGTGGTPSRGRMERYYEGGTIPWVKSGELRESIICGTEEHVTEAALRETRLRLVPAGTLLLAMYGATVGRLGILGVPATTNQAVCHIIPDPHIATSRYLFHALSNQVSNLVARRVGGAQPNISQGIIKDLLLPLPPLPEQRRIAAILDKTDEVRAKRWAALEQLNGLTQAMFLEMFGDPARNPKAWPVVPISDLLVSACYGTSEKAGAVGAFPILRMGNVTATGEIDRNDLKFIDLRDADIEKFTVRVGDILFNRTNSPDLVGKAAIVRTTTPTVFAGYLIRLRVNDENHPEYLSAFLNTAYAKRVLRGMCKTIIGMANINATEIQRMTIPKPPLATQQEFARVVCQLEQLKASLRASSGLHNALFASLQQQAFSRAL